MQSSLVQRLSLRSRPQSVVKINVGMNSSGQNSEQLLLEIAHCPVARQHCEHPEIEGACSTIVATQKASSWEGFQVPEPWSGDLVNAPILFLSSNPSISDTEAFPRGSSGDAAFLDFFNGRFDGHWIRGGNRPRNNDGTYGKAVAYWSSIRNRASELLNDGIARPGVDFALSEVIHCKSKNQTGVQSALANCADRHLMKLLFCSGAAVVVLVGRKTLNYWNSLSLGLPNVPERGGTDFQEMAGRKRLFAFLPHPASFEVEKRFADRISADKINQIRSILRDS